MTRRVVITGLGALSSAGATVAESRDNFIAGRACLRPIEHPDVAHLKARFAGLLAGFDPTTLLPEPELRAADKHVQMAVVAAREALTAARLSPAALGHRMGLVFSTCSGPMLLIEAHYERILRGQPELDAAGLFAKRYYSGARLLARALGIQGFSTTVVTACSASTSAIALAADLIRCGLLDAALAGGADAFSLSTLAGFDSLKATSDTRCAPFSKPFGLNLGEAAAFVVLETLASAQQRGAARHAEVLGSGMSNDAFHCSSPEPAGRGLSLAIQRALRDASLTPADISYVNAHGTGTEANDKAESKALRRTFGEHAARVPVSSTKSMVGHCLGAAGAIEAIASLVCAEAGVLPPTANFTEPREGCPLDYVPQAHRPWPAPRTFLSNNSAFGGHNASLVLAATPEGNPNGPGPDRVSQEPIVITAVGLVSALGIGAATLLEGVRHGRSGLRTIEGREPIAQRNADAPLQAARMDFAAIEQFDRRLPLRPMDRSSRWATVATQLAIREGHYSEKPGSLAELGLFLNLSAGPSWAESEFLTSFLSHGRQVTEVLAFPYIVPSSVAGNVCRALMLAGHNVTLCGGPGAGLLGLGHAVGALRCGHVEAILSGAVDELSDRILADQCSAGLLSGPGSLPPGEGAAVLLLETERHARHRHAAPLAWVCGMAFSTDTHHSHQPDPDASGLDATIHDALEQAQIGAADVGAVCWHGPARRVEAALDRLHPDLKHRRVDATSHTGCLEGAQPLVDLAVALFGDGNTTATRPYILAVVSSAHGVNAALVFRKVA